MTDEIRHTPAETIKASFLQERRFQPQQPSSFWCNRCDTHVVDSEKQETGSFFLFFGHAYSQQTKHFDGDYHGVMLALCTACLEREADGASIGAAD